MPTISASNRSTATSSYFTSTMPSRYRRLPETGFCRLSDASKLCLRPRCACCACRSSDQLLLRVRNTHMTQFPTSIRRTSSANVFQPSHHVCLTCSSCPPPQNIKSGSAPCEICSPPEKVVIVNVEDDFSRSNTIYL